MTFPRRKNNEEQEGKKTTERQTAVLGLKESPVSHGWTFSWPWQHSTLTLPPHPHSCFGQAVLTGKCTHALFLWRPYLPSGLPWADASTLPEVVPFLVEWHVEHLKPWNLPGTSKRSHIPFGRRCSATLHWVPPRCGEKACGGLRRVLWGLPVEEGPHFLNFTTGSTDIQAPAPQPFSLQLSFFARNRGLGGTCSGTPSSLLQAQLGSYNIRIH